MVEGVARIVEDSLAHALGCLLRIKGFELLVISEQHNYIRPFQTGSERCLRARRLLYMGIIALHKEPFFFQSCGNLQRRTFPNIIDICFVGESEQCGLGILLSFDQSFDRINNMTRHGIVAAARRLDKCSFLRRRFHEKPRINGDTMTAYVRPCVVYMYAGMQDGEPCHLPEIYAQVFA